MKKTKQIKARKTKKEVEGQRITTEQSNLKIKDMKLKKSCFYYFSYFRQDEREEREERQCLYLARQIEIEIEEEIEKKRQID